MYTNPPDTSQLRQGDVITDFYFPRYSFGTLELLHGLTDAGDTRFSEKAQVAAHRGPGVVVSQCCEFNAGKRNAFSLAALKPLQTLLKPAQIRLWGFNIAELVPVAHSTYRGAAGIRDELLEALRSANRVDPDAAQNDAVNVYYFEPDGDFLSEPHLADFTRIVSVRMKDQHRILLSKVLELNAVHRREFQLKLAYYYGRKAE